jgi:hypothetical protein
VISLFVGANHAPQYDHDLINCHRGICWSYVTKAEINNSAICYLLLMFIY